MNVDLPAQLMARLQEPLPGWPAQVRFQPELSFGRHRGPAGADARAAAVLVLVYPRQGEWHVPLILRPAHMPDHAGQISLPGGVIEPGESSREAALREFTEELGATAEGLEILGPLSPLYLFASNYQITPWVAAARGEPAWRPSSFEVERLLEISLAHLLDPSNRGTVEKQQRGLTFHAPCYLWQGERIWGATSMILAEFLAGVGPLGV
jgi:8-oxo-dGTP pyrophosphatase MutT (NUDIX family)